MRYDETTEMLQKADRLQVVLDKVKQLKAHLEDLEMQAERLETDGKYLLDLGMNRRAEASAIRDEIIALMTSQSV